MAIQETRTLPAPFVEEIRYRSCKQITAQAQVPVVAQGIGGIAQQAGESAADFAKRQQCSKQFDIRQQSLAGLAPQVAGLRCITSSRARFSTTRYRFFSTIFRCSKISSTNCRNNISWNRFR